MAFRAAERAGAAAAKRREEKKEETEQAEASRMSEARFNEAKERWRTADQETRDRWLRQIPDLLRPKDPDVPGIVFLSHLVQLVEKDKSPVLPGLDA